MRETTDQKELEELRRLAADLAEIFELRRHGHFVEARALLASLQRNWSASIPKRYPDPLKIGVEE